MGKKKFLRTIDLARAAGIHPNTVRRYEDWGFLPPIPRDPRNHYRQYSERHLDLLRLARLGLGCTLIGSDVRKSALSMIYTAARGDLGGALELAYQLVINVQAERAQAE